MGAGGKAIKLGSRLARCVHSAEQDAQPPFALASSIEVIACEVAGPVDEIARPRRPAAILRRCRRSGPSASIANAPDLMAVSRRSRLRSTSSFGSFIWRGHAPVLAWADLDPTHERLVLAVGPRRQRRSGRHLLEYWIASGFSRRVSRSSVPCSINRSARQLKLKLSSLTRVRHEKKSRELDRVVPPSPPKARHLE